MELSGRRFGFAFFCSATLSLAILSGCGSGPLAANHSNSIFSITSATSDIDTSCTGCNATSAHGGSVQRFAATLNSGSPASVTWTVDGGDPVAGPGTIDSGGEYRPPSYLTADRVEVRVTASLRENSAIRASTLLTVTPGFLRPLTPENVALGANGTATITGYLAEAGGSSSIRFALADLPSGAGVGQGTLGVTNCVHSRQAFTSCSVSYNAPSGVPPAGVTYVVAIASGAGARTEAAILLNGAGVASNPAGHQGQLASPMQLGSSGGNNSDFDARGNTVADCCSGTLGSLIQDSNGRQYLLSNNHVLARSDHASLGDAIVQPGLIDNNCTPNGDGPGTVPVATLTGWLPLRSNQTNVDAAIAQVASHTVDPTGSILELGARQADGSLAAAPPGISSTGGKGESATLQLRVAKSGRTTGLTCGGVSALDVDVSVDYFRDCAETRPYLTRMFSNQVAVSGDRFSDAGDSGALLVDTTNAEPVGLFFAGGTDASGVGQGMANPAVEVLNELSSQAGVGSNFTFVGTGDHAVSCLSYGDSTVASAQARALSDAEIARGVQALTAARSLVNPAAGILGVGMGKSTDHPGTAAVLIYVDENAQPSVPATIEGVRTQVIPTTAHAVAFGSAPLANSLSGQPSISGAALAQAITIKKQHTRFLMQNPAFFAVGVGQSFDNPREAALVIYVDRRRVPASLSSTLDGLRTRYIIMDRLHVTRSFAPHVASATHCAPPQAAEGFDPASLLKPLKMDLF